MTSKIPQITINNIAAVTPDELLTFLHEEYDEVVACRDSALDITDLSTMQGYLGWCQNLQSFLLPLLCKMDIETRKYKTSKDPNSAYQQAQSKKNILALYYDHFDKVFKTISRQFALYEAQHKEYDRDHRSGSVGYIQPEIIPEEPQWDPDWYNNAN